MVHIRREIEIMSSLRHPHIISIYEGEGSLHIGKEARQITHARFALNARQTNRKTRPLPQLIRRLWPSCGIVML